MKRLLRASLPAVLVVAALTGTPGAGAAEPSAVGVASTPAGDGHWVVTSHGIVHAGGAATSYGSLAGRRLNQPIVGIAATPTGKGYWLAARDGGVFTFGDATFHGSTGGIRLNQPIVGMAATPTGRGYWLAARDGGVFTFGDAGFAGSAASRTDEPVVGMAASGTGRGYWLATEGGGVLAFGDAPFAGSGTGPVAGISAARGYRLVSRSGYVTARTPPGPAPAPPSPGEGTVTPTPAPTRRPGPQAPPPGPVPEPAVPAGRLPRFAPDSFWYQRIPADAPLHPQSAALVADFDRQWREHYDNVGVNTSTYAPPIFVASASTPTQRVRFWDCQGKGYADRGFVEQMAAVPIPADARPSAGTDAELVISQPATDSLWDLWKARILPDGSWEACWGGRLTGVSRSQGTYAHPYGTTATGLSLAGGLITPEALQAGRIDHALAVSLVEPKRGVFSWPANRTDGWVDAASAIPEGLRLRLDPTIDVDALPITRTARIVAKALQAYGMVIRDKSGAVTFYAENLAAEGRPDTYGNLFGAPNYRVLAGIPWHRLQALPMDYGR